AREFLGVSTGSLNERLFISPFPFVNEQGQPLLPAQQPEARLMQGENLTGANATDVRLRRDHGREMELSVTGTPLSTEDGGISGAIMVAHDVTARRKLERRTHSALDALLVMAESLVSSEVSAQPGETSQVVMQHLAELTSRVLDGEGAVMVVLAAGTDKIEDVVSTGFDEALESALQARLQGKLLAECLHDPDLVRPLREGHAYSLDMRKSPYQEIRPLDHLELALFIPLRLRNDLVGVLILYPTDPRRLYLAEEITLAEAVGKLVALVIERERLLREREEARASSLAARETTQRMDEFVGIVSHELKTPLTSLRGNLQLAKRYLKRSLPTGDELENQSVEMTKLVLSLLDRAEQQLMAQNRLVNDLVDVTRIQIDKLELQIARCDLKHLVQEIIDDQRSLIATRTILFEPPLEEIKVLADAQRVGQVVNNYLSNALKYSDKEKPVLVQIELLESAVQVSVHDEGPGISLEAQQRIWERFYRVPGIEVRSGAGVGLGLGLHICRTIIEQQGGAVGVESVQGQGSTFWFTLPYAQSLKTPEEYSSGVNN
ncbi:MAG TPA: ATP-binding protein, partial [Ktedonobacteraceae bacterium]|nr:ATP-binding protein [Ktedonobacteraceae bacterium]